MTRRREASFSAYKQCTLQGTCTRAGSQLIFRLPRRLESPNTWGTQQSTWKKAAARSAWRTHIALAYHSEFREMLTIRPLHEQRRMRLAVARHVPSEKNFIRDIDNQFGALKPFIDALRDLGLLRDDSEAWLEIDRPVQRVSDDRFDWTIATLAPVSEVTV